MTASYDDLHDVLQRALHQAEHGKGRDRHGNGRDFSDQPMMAITDAVGIGFPLGQAMKKAQEAMRMDRDPAVRELLGAINYLAGAVLALERDGEAPQSADPALSATDIAESQDGHRRRCEARVHGCSFTGLPMLVCDRCDCVKLSLRSLPCFRGDA